MFYLIRKLKPLNAIVKFLGARRAEFLVSKMSSYIKPGDKIIDIGCGVGNITRLLIRNGNDVTPLDIKNLSLHKDVTPLLYDGKKIPFKNNAFETSLLITVLHHIHDQEQVFAEAIRVSGQIIVIEDVFLSWFSMKLTHYIDSIINFEFYGHPHTNRDDRGWKQLFNQYDLDITYEEGFKAYGIIRQKIYVLKSHKS